MAMARAHTHSPTHLNAYIQVSLGSLVVVLFLVLQFTARPYIQDRMDILEGLCTVSVFFYVFAGMFFTNADLSPDEEVSEHVCSPHRNRSRHVCTGGFLQITSSLPETSCMPYACRCL